MDNYVKAMACQMPKNEDKSRDEIDESNGRIKILTRERGCYSGLGIAAYLRAPSRTPLDLAFRLPIP